MQINIIDKEIKKQYGSWKAFCDATGQDSSNFKRKLLQNIARIDKWIEPLNFEIQIKFKNKKQ